MVDLLLADLHLPLPVAGKASLFSEAFLRFCAGPAHSAQRVFILGDLFETWIGDDLGLVDYPQEVAALKALTDSGVAVYTQIGNRDFLLGAAFAKATGSQALPDESVQTLADGVPTLLAHGDQYCTEDLPYQRWRRFSRNRLAQWLFLKLPPERRRRIAGGLRNGSTTAKRAKASDIMDVTPAAIEAAFHRRAVQRMIHGHTHRPAEHLHTVDGQRSQRLVLADWRPERLEVLEVSPRGSIRKPV